MATNTNILFPQTPFIDPSTGRPSLPWVLWLQNPSFVNANFANALPIASGGTGISTAPTNGQLLIGNAGNYTLHTLTPSSGISVTNGAGLITVANTGVLSNIASSGISVSGATGNVTIANTGVLSAVGGSGISVSGATGNVTFANTGVLSFSGGSTGLTPATATTGAVSLAGTLAVAYGGTGQTTYTDGQLLIGNTTGNTLAKSTLTAGTGISISNGSGSITIANTLPSLGGTVTSVSVVTANGLAGTVATATTTPAITLSTTITGLLKGNGTAISAATSGTDYAPATSGTSILYGNGSGGFSNVTIGSGISFVTGTLSATGSGGTVTSVGLSLPSIFTVSGSPVTGTGTLTGTFNTQTANYVFAGPTTGAAATPTFRALVAADIPNNAANTTGYASNIAGGLAGSIPYQTAVNATSLLGIGTTGQILRVVSGLPAWGTDYVGTVTSVAALTLGTTGTDLSSTVANGTTTPVITLNVPTASATNRGALSSADWTTFNNKGSGTVTSVTGTSPVVSSGGTTPAISMPVATTSVNGYLSSTDWTTFNNKGSGSVTSVSFTGGIITVATATTTPAFTVAGTSGGIPYFSSATTWATSAALAANSLVIGGGAAVAPSTITTGTGVVTALGVAVGSAGAFVVNGGALGTPSSGTVTNLTGTAAINITGTAPAGTLTGTILNSTVVTSSLTTVGTIGSGIWQGNAVGPTYGGTGQTTVTTGDLLYGSASNVWSKLGIGTTGQILRVVSGAPAWGTDYVGTVTSVGGTGTVNGITLTGTVTSSGNLTLGGTLSGVSLTTQVSGVLPVANGGTNASTASITSFNNITGYTASGATGTTSTNLVFSTSPSITTPTLVGDATLSTGNIIQGTAAKGFNFTANTPKAGMTSQLLNWYEEGTWTPVLSYLFTVLGTVTLSGKYTRIGKIVQLSFYISCSGGGSVAMSSGAQMQSVLPFTPSATSVGSWSIASNFGATTSYGGIEVENGGTTIYFANAWPAVPNYSYAGSITYTTS